MANFYRQAYLALKEEKQLQIKNGKKIAMVNDRINDFLVLAKSDDYNKNFIFLY